MKKIQVTQIKSKIGRTARQKKTLEALGLKKINQTNELVVSEPIMGMIEKVKHLIKVEEI